ncbi:hypothetical protein DYBT9275_04022 [Dyadobacter sp. CECT 9275]|uniref:Uncharacterized protein n=1 Tax=Dyadobacter helix TaxID=2822344 RepID=A0A916JFY6_9BACT|nr:hypothetical protein [Dyadobacter sp. CECT 9275]CAG5007329.1 hypothetical protein DYBT9275_04022 [Dyadobacter sp. CECT 9275]
METLLVTIRDNADIKKIEKALHEIDGISVVKRLLAIDESNLLSEPSLSEEWESEEDQRWNNLI